MQSSHLNRRQLLQRMTSISLGGVLLPFAGIALPRQTSPDPVPIHIPAGGGKKGKVGDMDILFKFSSKETSSLLGAWETVIQPGELGAPPHYHAKVDEICRVLEGSVTILCGNDVTEVKAGGWHLRPRGVVHTFWNGGKVPAKTIDLCIPGGHEYYMEDLARLFENNARPKPGEVAKLGEKHDIHFRFDLLQGIMEKYQVKL